MKRFLKRSEGRKPRSRERGIALFIALVALLLLAAIAAGMMFMANTESAINYNYRDAQYTYFAAGAGLEDARELMRTDNNFLPQNPPSTTNAKGIIYILNPGVGETVEPWNPANAYFDDEICHEYPSELGITDTGANTPCTQGPPAGSYTVVNETSLAGKAGAITVNGGVLTGTAAALSYKWVRIGLKFNYTLVPTSTGSGYPVVNGGVQTGANALVCWENQAGHEFLINTYNNLPKGLMPAPQTSPSEFEWAALQKAIDMGVGTPAVMMFGGKGKSTSTSGTTTSSSGGGTGTGSTSGSTSGTTSGSTTGSSSGSSGGGTGTSSGTTTGTTSGTTTGTTSGTTTGTTTGTTSGTTTGSGGYYKLVDACNATNKYRFSVYLITSMAAGKNGAKRMSQYEISRTLFPGVPGGLTFNGPGATFAPPSSTNFLISGDDHAVNNTASGGQCPGPGSKIHSVTAFGSTDATNITTKINSKDSDCNAGSVTKCSVTGLGSDRGDINGDGTADPLVPDVINGSAIDPQTGTKPLDGLTTIKENQDLVDSLTSSADLLVTSDVNSLADVKNKNTACTSWPMGTNDTSAPAVCQGPKITVLTGNNVKMSNPNGVGILLITGTAELDGNLAWDGLILVIGDGKLTFGGGGNKTINGGVYVANTKDPSGNLGAVSVDVSGGGNSSILYNSCKIADAVGNQSFRVIAYREMTY